MATVIPVCDQFARAVSKAKIDLLHRVKVMKFRHVGFALYTI